MPASIFNGDSVKILKDKLKFKNGGLAKWDYTNNCLAYETNIPGVVNQVGQETHVRVVNDTALTIPNGAVVYISGSNMALGVPRISLASASTHPKSRVLGMVTADILAGAEGIVTRDGVVNDLDTSAYNNGDVLYLDPAVDGGWTTTMPNDGNYSVTVGIVARKDAATGSVIVFHDANEFTTETNSRTGWSKYGLPSLSFVDGTLGATRTLTLTPIGSNFHWYQEGVKYSKTTDSIPLPDTEGLYIIYYNADVLTALLNPTDAQIATIIRNNTTVAYVYWDFTNRVHLYLGTELHDMQYPSLVHLYAHFSFGARYEAGLALTGFVADANGSLGSHAQFGIDSGTVADEDILLATPTVASTVGFPIYYLAGTSGAPTLRKGTNAGFSVLTAGTGRLAYNFLTGGNWTVAEVTNTNFAMYHIFCINENTPAKRIISIMGQAQYTTLALARAAALTEILSIQLSGVVPKEMKSIGSVIFETNNTYANAVKSRIRTISTGVNYQDWRSTNTTGGSVSTGAPPVTIFPDNTFQIYDNGDATKTFQFEASAISTSTNRIVSVPDRSVTLGNISAWATSTNYGTTATVYYAVDRRIYQCLVAHTSGAFATDLASGKWGELSPTKRLPLSWVNDSLYAAIEDTSTYGLMRYGFAPGEASKIKTSFVVPKDYVTGTPLNLGFKVHSATGSGTVLMTTTATLLRNNIDPLTYTTNQRVSVNTAVTMTGVDLEIRSQADLTFTDGTIAGVGIGVDDTILIELYRGTDTNTDIAYIIASNTGVLL